MDKYKYLYAVSRATSDRAIRCYLTLYDTTYASKLSPVERNKIQQQLETTYKVWENEGDHVSELEKLHPEYSDSQLARDYHQFVNDSLLDKKYGKILVIIFDGKRSPLLKHLN